MLLLPRNLLSSSIVCTAAAADVQWLKPFPCLHAESVVMHTLARQAAVQDSAVPSSVAAVTAAALLQPSRRWQQGMAQDHWSVALDADERFTLTLQDKANAYMLANLQPSSLQALA